MKKLEVGMSIKFTNFGCNYSGVICSFITNTRIEVRYTGDSQGWCSIDTTDVLETI